MARAKCRLNPNSEAGETDSTSTGRSAKSRGKEHAQGKKKSIRSFIFVADLSCAHSSVRLLEALSMRWHHAHTAMAWSRVCRTLSEDATALRLCYCHQSLVCMVLSLGSGVEGSGPRVNIAAVSLLLSLCTEGQGSR